MDFSGFNNSDIVSIIEEAGKVSMDLNLMEIEPLSVLFVLNNRYTDELRGYLNTCGISPEVFYNRVVKCEADYPHQSLKRRSLRMSSALVNALQSTLEIESKVQPGLYPNAPLITALLITPGPLKDLVENLGISLRQMEKALMKPSLYFDPVSQTFKPIERREISSHTDVICTTQEHLDEPVSNDSITPNNEVSFPTEIGLKCERAQFDDFISAAVKMRERGLNAHLECDTIVIGSTGTGKNFLANDLTRRLYEARLIQRPAPIVIDAVNWNVFEKNLGQNLEDIADGVLVIDNVQKLVSENDNTNIGTLDALFSAMVHLDSRPIVMLLGLPEGMNQFLVNNPSVSRRFEYIFTLKNYSAEELTEICRITLQEKFHEDIDVACRARLCNIFKHLLRNKPETWAAAHTAVKKADSIFMSYSLKGRSTITTDDISGIEDRDLSVEEALAKLDDYVGVDKIKDEFRAIISDIEYDKERYGGNPSIRSHFVFTGNPGTGKTTIARVFADVLKAMKVLPSGHLVEADRSMLVSAYVGQTAIKTNELIDKALGGVLFIDEAYTLVNDNESGSGFGKEAIDTLLKRLEDDRGKFVCIVAGYTKEMHDFLQSNPGMQSRFNKVIEFRDYTGQELKEIFSRLLSQNQFKLSGEANECVDQYFNNMYLCRTRNFGNAREVRNVFDQAKQRQSRRLSSLRAQGVYTPEMAFVITREDIEGGDANSSISLEDVMSEMDNEFVGMQSVKDAVRNLAMTIAANKRRLDAGIGKIDKINVHLLLTGNPGTGKTTVARILGKVFKAIGLLPTDKVLEVDKSMLVGQYVGTTPQKVNEVVDRAMGGVLFIDEAYTLSQDSGSGNSFGKEAIETLMKRLEDDRGKFVCIMAGYRNLMEEFVRVNPGIDSRISHRIHIEDYSADELLSIFSKMVEKQGFKVDPGAAQKIQRAIDEMVTTKSKDFGNAREIRKLLDKILTIQANRIQSFDDSVPQNELITIKEEDIPIDVPSGIDERVCLEELDSLVGLDNVKQEIRNITHYLKLEKMRCEAMGKRFVGVKDHYLFLGNPGTGKTTVARILGKIFLALGISKSSRFVETDRSCLVAGYVGQTSPLTNRVIDSAMGGILFIDEAYTLSQGFNDSFGQEAIDTLLKRMEDDRGKFVCIAAGYSQEMRQFINSNSGLQSRFNKIINFEDYSVSQLIEIFINKISAESFVLAPGADIAMMDMVNEIARRRTANFGNAREINTLFQKVKENQSNRLYQSMGEGITLSKSDMLTLVASDFRN